MTKKNVEAKSHFESKHPTSTFATCFPGQVDPTVPGFMADESASKSSSGSSSAPKGEGGTTKKKTEDLSFLDSALESKQYKKK